MLRSPIAAAGPRSIVADYPPARVPVLPVVDWGTCVGRRTIRYPTALQAGWALDVTSGTAALALAVEHAGIGAGEKVLLPAFHCRSMIEPFLAVGAQPVYYRVAADLAVDLQDIQTKLRERPRALLVAHYFGFYQDMPALRSLCDTHGIVLIEDCAHAFFGAINGWPVGSYGDYAIASARKFFAVEDGGYLVSARHPPRESTTEAGGFAFNLKSALNSLESALAFGRLAPASYALAPMLAFEAYVWKKVKARRRAEAASIGPGVSAGYQYVDLAWIRKRMSAPSRWLVRLSATNTIVERRRANYQRLVSRLSGFPGVRPLFPKLPDDVVPYMVPVVFDRPESVFPVLKHKGAPIWRWEDLEPTDCDVSHDYSRSLFQLPCHQALRAREIDSMVASIRGSLASEAD